MSKLDNINMSISILDNINMKLFQATKMNQWKNTVSAIKSFNSLKDKHLMKFLMFDIKDFYPSITQDLLNKALNFASEYIYISKCDIDVINHARKSLLFDGSNTWIKKQGGLFDVSWAHICLMYYLKNTTKMILGLIGMMDWLF